MHPHLLTLRVSTRGCTICVPALKCLTGVHMAVACNLSTAHLALVRPHTVRDGPSPLGSYNRADRSVFRCFAY